MRKSLLLYLLFIASSIIAQSPWVMDKRSYYAQLTYNIIPKYHSLFLENGSSFETYRFVTDQTIQFYGEYGLLNWLTAITSIPYKIIKLGDINSDYTGDITNAPSKQTITGFSNLHTGLRIQLFNKKFVSAWQLSFKSRVKEINGVQRGYDANTYKSTLSAGRGWERTYFYSFASFIMRDNDYSNYYSAGLEFGRKFISSIYLIFYSELYQSLKDGSVQNRLNDYELGLYTNNLEYFSWGIKVIYGKTINKKKLLGFKFDFAGAFSGHLQAHSPYLSIGVSLKHQ